MKTFLLVIEFITAVGLIGAILLHSPKTEGMGAIQGSARVFQGSNDLEAGLNRVTGILAVIFMVVAFILGVFF